MTNDRLAVSDNASSSASSVSDGLAALGGTAGLLLQPGLDAFDDASVGARPEDYLGVLLTWAEFGPMPRALLAATT